ncbi:MAG: type II toxin-antitoxin system VapC family toxin [Acidobacteriota bacterium]|jgi:predicted nucleic acid-binding protein
MIVVDASAVLEVLLQTPAAPRIADRLFDPDETLHAPELLDLEVLQVLRRYWYSGEIGDERGRQALDDLEDLGVERYPHGPLLPRVWELRGNVTAYDATYLALAEALDAPLLTCDGRLARSVMPDTEIELFPSSG